MFLQEFPIRWVSPHLPHTTMHKSCFPLAKVPVSGVVWKVSRNGSSTHQQFRYVEFPDNKVVTSRTSRSRLLRLLHLQIQSVSSLKRRMAFNLSHRSIGKLKATGKNPVFFCSCKFHTELVVPTSKRHQILTMASGCHNEHCVFFTPYYSSYLEV